LARVTRSLNTKTASGANEPGGVKYNEGDLVDIYRPPASKDVSGWKGPYRVVRVAPADGQIIVSMAGKDRPNRIGDVRLTLFACMTLFALNGTVDNSVRTLLSFLSSLPSGSAETFGTIFTTQLKPATTRASREFPQIVLALTHVLQNCFNLDVSIVHAVRLARCVASLPRLTNMTSCRNILLMNNSSLDNVLVVDTDSTKVSISNITDNWKQTRVIQICYADSECINLGELASSQPSAPSTPAVSDAASTTHDRLSTIAEENESQFSSDSLPADATTLEAFASAYFHDVIGNAVDLENLRPVWLAFVDSMLNTDTSGDGSDAPVRTQGYLAGSTDPEEVLYMKRSSCR
jgi:hypothetical protein